MEHSSPLEVGVPSGEFCKADFRRNFLWSGEKVFRWTATVGKVHGERVALVTGASRGIGRAIARRLGEDGAVVVCVSRSVEANGQTAADLLAMGVRHSVHAADVASPAAVGEMCEKVLAEYGRVDILVNCAGINRDGLLIRMGDGDWDAVLRTDLDSCFALTRHLCRPMLQNRWGRIINISSVIGLVGNAGQANYAAAKAGVIGFTKSIAREFATRNITANAIAPGFIETDMTAAIGEKARELALAAIPQRRFGTPDDIAAAASFLASDAAGYITGQVLAIDGGMTMCG
jgi:3-oxoacyl-[acyl-carrier protein] reductase